MWRFLGLSSDQQSGSAKPPPARSLPASWYTAPSMYQLERRAIFSRKWVLVTHSMRFKEAGDYLSFEVANYSFFLVLDRSGSINGFHNICRHRAYPIVQAREGTARILSCKYHGWSYGFTGNLAKAPRFDTVEGFDKSQHGLLPINAHIDKAGFVWVNLQAGTPELKWEDDFSAIDRNAGLQAFDFAEEFSYSHTWSMELNANWKALVDNYNECYHCPTSHPLIAGVTDLTKYRVEPNAGCLEHTIINKKQDEEDEFRRSITFCYPGTSVTATSNFFYIQRMIPLTATTSKIENEVYRHKNASDEEFDTINAFYKQVLEEDKDLCNFAQENLNNGVYINGELHPEKEKGPIYFQDTVRKDVMQHRQKEEQQGGKEWWPAVPLPAGEMRTCKLDEEEMFCSQLESAACSERAELAW